MRVLLVNKFHYRKGGSETYCFALAEGLRRAGHEVAFFSMQDERNLPCDQAKYFVSSKDYNGPSSLGQKLGYAASLIYSREARERFDDLCRDFKPDVIHLNLVHRQITFSILDAPAIQGVPVVYTSHDYILVCPGYTMLDGTGEVCDACLSGHFANCARKRCVKGSLAKSVLAAGEAHALSLRKSYEKVDRFIAPSEFMRDKLVEGGFSEDKVVTIQNFAPDDVAGHAHNDADGTDRQHPYMLFFGRLSPEKGIEGLIRSFLAVAPDLQGAWSLVIAGDGPLREFIESFLDGAPGAERVRLVGFKSGEELQELVRGASFVVVPSIWRENMPYSIIESFAQGTPVIGSRIGGIPELVRDGETGFLCEAGDEVSLARTIEKATRVVPEDYRSLQAACREYVLARCDQSAYVGEVIALYEQVRREKKQGV